MKDTNLLFSNAAAITTTADSTALTVDKTSERGVVVELVVSAVAGSTTGLTLDAIVKESADGTTYNNLVTFAQITGTGRWQRRVQSKKKYLRISYTAGAATGLSFTVTAGIESGFLNDQAA